MAERLLHEQTADGWLEVWQDGDRRSLWFDDQVLQSEIDLNDPTRLPNPANRAMLAHLMFGQSPRRVLLAGCGGGGIARWFAARSPDTRGVAVERCSRVAEIARSHFQFPAANRGWTLERADVRDYLAEPRAAFDFILVDIAERGYTPDWASEPEFLRYSRLALSPAGILTLNLLARDRDEFTARLYRIRQAFDRHTLCLGVPEHDNVLVLAFSTPPDLDDLDARLPERQRHWGLEFDRMLNRLRRQNPPGSGVF